MFVLESGREVVKTEKSSVVDSAKFERVEERYGLNET